METYNYPHFKPEHYSVSEFRGPKAGETFEDLNVFDLDGKNRKLSQYIGRQPVVLETVSITSPVFAHTREAMHQLQQVYPDVLFLLLYVREAHPGNITTAHRSMASKLVTAKYLVDSHKEQRTVLVDDSDGSGHKT